MPIARGKSALGTSNPPTTLNTIVIPKIIASMSLLDTPIPNLDTPDNPARTPRFWYPINAQSVSLKLSSGYAILLSSTLLRQQISSSKSPKVNTFSNTASVVFDTLNIANERDVDVPIKTLIPALYA